MAASALPRPRRLGIACVIAGAVAFLQLVQSVGGLSVLGSTDQQDIVSEALRTWGLAGSVSVDTSLTWLGWYYRLTAVLAVVIGILVLYVSRGHRGSRTAFTVLAPVTVVVFLALGVPGVLPAAMLVYGLAGVWSPDGRWWFAALAARERGEPLPEAPGAAREAARGTGRGSSRDDRPDPLADRPATPPAPPTGPAVGARQKSIGHTGPDAPRPGDRPFAAGPQQGPQQGGWGPPPPHAGWGRPMPQRRARPPRSVNLAVLVTSVLAALVGLVCGLNALVYLLAPETYRSALASQDAGSRLMEQTGLGVDELSHWLFVGTAGGAALAACALAAALWMLLRAAPARVVLTVLSSLTLGLGLAAFPVGLLWAGGAGYVLYLMYREDANAWFRRQP